MMNAIDTAVDFDRQSTSTSASKKQPKLVYCGDGVLEEYSDDEEENEKIERENAIKNAQNEIDAKTLPWMPWFKYYATAYASKGLSACDYMGEKLAWWLGITQPKYLYEIEEYNRMQQKYENSDDDADEIVVDKLTHILMSSRLPSSSRCLELAMRPYLKKDLRTRGGRLIKNKKTALMCALEHYIVYLEKRALESNTPESSCQLLTSTIKALENKKNDVEDDDYVLIDDDEENENEIVDESDDDDGDELQNRKSLKRKLNRNITEPIIKKKSYNSRYNYQNGSMNESSNSSSDSFTTASTNSVICLEHSESSVSISKRQSRTPSILSELKEKISKSKTVPQLTDFNCISFDNLSNLQNTATTITPFIIDTEITNTNTGDDMFDLVNEVLSSQSLQKSIPEFDDQQTNFCNELYDELIQICSTSNNQF